MAKIVDYFQYVKFDGDVLFFFCFRTFFCKFFPKNPLGILMLSDKTGSSLLAET